MQKASALCAMTLATLLALVASQKNMRVLESVGHCLQQVLGLPWQCLQEPWCLLI
jgi:hypothetical protein